MDEMAMSETGQGNGTTTEDLIRRQLQIQRELDQRRQDVTVLFSDIVGSTQYAREHGDSKSRILQERHVELLKKQCLQYRGFLINKMGDGLFYRFDSASAAVSAACSAMQILDAENGGLPDEKSMHIRIGIASGKALVEEGDVNGNVVNLAARLCKKAEVDGILIDDQTYKDLDLYQAGNCLPLQPSAIRGLEKETINAYRVVWDPKGPARARRIEALYLVLDIAVEGDNLKETVRYEGQVQQTVSQQRNIPWNESEVDRISKRIIAALKRGTSLAGQNPLETLISSGRALYDMLLTSEAKEALKNPEIEYLTLSIQDSLVFIPWEILHDGREFLCRRFALGRRVVSGQRAREVRQRSTLRPHICIISDPRRSLPSAREEGEQIHAQLLANQRFRVGLKTGATTEYVRRIIRESDIVHYCGHADYSSQNPGESGWLLSNGRITGADIMQMSEGESNTMPLLVFSNACRSAVADEWNGEGEKHIYGMASSFLLAGVQHYIGTLWDVLDSPSHSFALRFYESLLRGNPIGYALRDARRSLAREAGEECLIWASYILYGDPGMGVFGIPDIQPVVISEPGPEPDKKDETPQQKRHSTEDATQSSNASLFEADVKVSSKILSWPVSLGCAAVIATVLIIAFFAFNMRTNNPPPVPSPSPTSMGVVDVYLAKLSERLKDPEYQKKLKEFDSWTSRPLTLALLPLVGKGEPVPPSGILDLYETPLYNQVKQIPSIYEVVEREKLQQILEEQNLSASELTDSSVIVQLGRTMAARLMFSGSLIGEGTRQNMAFRVFDVETTVIVAADVVSGAGRDEIVRAIAVELQDKIAENYPIQGRIDDINGKDVYINIGEAVGLQSGDVLRVFEDAPEKGSAPREFLREAARLEVKDINDVASYAQVLDATQSVRKDMRVRAIRRVVN